MCFIIPFKIEIKEPVPINLSRTGLDPELMALILWPIIYENGLVLEPLVLCSSKPGHLKFPIHFENDIHPYLHRSMEPLNFSWDFLISRSKIDFENFNIISKKTYKARKGNISWHLYMIA